MKKRFLSVFLALALCLSLLTATAWAAGDYADTVVYGTIRTAETKNPVAEAIAIKDGKYVYVGDETGVAAFIKDGVTQILDHRGKGMVMPGCTDGHSHYTMKFGMENMKGGLMFALEDDKAAVLQKVETATLAAKNAGKQSLFGFGWNYLALTMDPPTLAELDNVTHGVSTIIFDQGGHHAFCNSECLKRSGIIDGKGGALIKEIDGGYLELDDSGYPTGYADERVTGYMMRNGGIDYDELIDDEVAETSIKKTQELLLSTGYIMALDGWSNMFHPSKLYEAANRLDKNGDLMIVFPMTYEVEPWQTDAEIESEIENLASLKETYGTSHVLPEYLKLFMDGVVETKTGAMLKPYKDGTVYKGFWSVDRLAEITKTCNAKGLTVHTHVMGDAAIKDTTDAYIQGGDGTHRNCMVHLRNVRQEDFQRFADNNIACSAGITWHVDGGDESNTYLAEFLEPEYINQAYPIKSFFDAGVKVSSHSDFPANIPCPQDPFGIMEVAVTGTIPDPSTGEMLPVYDKDQLVTVEQAFQALTINGAWQLGLENERGSIKVGKWADFVLADKDVFTCQKADIGKTKVVSTWFEGKMVYAAAYDANTMPFVDVPETAYYYDAVKWAAKNLITEGTDKAHFNPNGIASRAQMVTFLWRAAGCPEPTITETPFTDLNPNGYYYKAVLLAYENGITDGTSETTFEPAKSVSRAEAVSFLWRYAGKPVVNYYMNMSDVASGKYYTEAVRWALAEKITDGTSTTTFSPNDNCLRNQIACFLYRYFVK